jgi:hypothetical protein
MLRLRWRAGCRGISLTQHLGRVVTGVSYGKCQVRILVAHHVGTLGDSGIVVESHRSDMCVATLLVVLPLY